MGEEIPVRDEPFGPAAIGRFIHHTLEERSIKGQVVAFQLGTDIFGNADHDILVRLFVRILEQEEDKLDQLVIRELYAFKDAYVLSQIKEIQAQIKNTQNNEDMEQVFELMKKLTRLNEIKNILSKELGERIILKM